MKHHVLVSLAMALTAAPVVAQEQRATEAARMQPVRWQLVIGAEQSYETNVPYAPLVSRDDFVTRAEGRLGVSIPIPHGTLDLAGDGGANVYRTITGLDRFTWGLEGGVQHNFTRRSMIDVRARAAQAFARDDPRLEATGVLPPLTLTSSDTADALWRHSVARRLETRIRAHAEQFRFDAPGLQNGWTASAILGLDHSVTRRVTVAAEGEYAQTATSPSGALSTDAATFDTLGRKFDIERLASIARINLARHVALEVEGGATRFQSLTPGTEPTARATSPAVAYPPTITPTGVAAVAAAIRHQTISLLASRRVEQTYGLGTVGINRVEAVAYHRGLARWLGLTITGAVNHNGAPDGTLLSAGRSLVVRWDLPLSGQVTIRATYSYWNQNEPARWHNHTIAVGLSKRLNWR